MEILIEDVSKVYPGGQVAVDRLTLSIPSGSTLCLLGTSGCGKTTTLKMINRLVEPTSGRVTIGGVDVAKRDPIELRREIGYVIQGGGLFPHMTVADNVSLVGRLSGWDSGRCDARVHELLELVQLDPATFARRFPAQLSGGQRQRVGVARALMVEPPVILMDEPFGALDPLTRHDVQQHFIALKARLAKTIVFVTHDLGEALRMADFVALMDGGKLVQAGTPADLWGKPATPFVQRFVSAQATPVPGSGA